MHFWYRFSAIAVTIAWLVAGAVLESAHGILAADPNAGSQEAVSVKAVHAAPIMPPPTVTVDKVMTLNEPFATRHVGMITAIERVDIMPRVTGNIEKVNFKEGAMVKEGDVLYEIEKTTYQAAYDSAKAQAEYAQINLDRSQKLRSDSVVAKNTLDDAIRSEKTAKAALMDAANNLSYTTIKAPITGRIGKNLFTRGNLITPNSGKLTDIEMVSPIYVRFALSERVFRSNFGGEQIKEKARVRLRLADGSTYPEEALVTLIDNKINAKTNTITLWATMANKDGALIPGSFVTVLLSEKLDSPSLAVNPASIVVEPDGTYVYVIGINDIAEKRKVKLGDMDERRQIILEGVKPGERVVVDGTHKVVPGNPVKPQEISDKQSVNNQ